MFNINANSNTPIYLQIVRDTKALIVAGILKEGDQMPSIRDLSTELLINQSTVSKAYKELERIGVIETQSGKGTFISYDNSKLSLEKEELLKKLEKLLAEAVFYGISLDEIEKIFLKVKGASDGN